MKSNTLGMIAGFGMIGYILQVSGITYRMFSYYLIIILVLGIYYLGKENGRRDALQDLNEGDGE